MIWKKRYTLVACNYRCRFGELRLVVGTGSMWCLWRSSCANQLRFASAMGICGQSQAKASEVLAQLWLNAIPRKNSRDLT
ncbi:MAG: hypothetical protein ACLSHU_04820 [Oscillospiraceae bacterium]